MATKPEPGAGDVELKFLHDVAVLKPSLGACMALTSDPRGLFGGPGSIYARVGMADITVMAWIVRLGLGVGASALPKLEEWLYESGLNNHVAPLQEFIGIVINGGRRPEPPKEGEGDDKSPPGAAA